MITKTVSELLKNRDEEYEKSTLQILQLFSDKLNKVFVKIYNDNKSKIKWNQISKVANSDKIVEIKGYISLDVGEKIIVAEKEITIDETNLNSYNKFVLFMFPINIVEHGTEEEIYEYINKILESKSSGDEMLKIMHTEYDNFEKLLLENPDKLEKVTRPKTIGGFSTDTLSEDQINKFKIFKNFTSEILN